MHQLGAGEISDDLDMVLDKYAEAFKEGLGTMKGVKANRYVDAGATPKYFKARPVPYFTLKKVEEELGRLEREGTIEPVQFLEWAAPIVPIVKEEQSIWICGDYKVTFNAVSKLGNYPIPKIEDLWSLQRGSEKLCGWTKSTANAVKLSEPPIPGDINMVLQQLEDSPVKVEQVRSWTLQVPLLAKITSYVKSGWPPKNTDTQMSPYYSIRTELSVEDGCLLRGSRVIIPLKG
ncbi:uncharacterized protein K02A2.6-like [Mizuhopecten yessoensis]|uniref:uncharacterized protein K02A2.6-like n=1 Tax=Mizuhopecten yessoensis TaxID=6573 RepID=UPI000B45D7E1|nr:uncharacterized protein K02A2.6-like [Mizuhopecten yessoensis]